MAAKTVPQHMPDATGPEETIYTTADIARKFHVNQRTVRLWVSSGLLGAIRLGKLLRIRQADLDAFTEVVNPRPVEDPSAHQDEELH